MSTSAERLQSKQRSRDYPERVARLRRLWINLEDKPAPVRYAGASSHRSGSPRMNSTVPRQDSSPASAAQDSPPAARSRRDASPSRALNSTATRRPPAAPKRAAAAPKRGARAPEGGALTARQIRDLMNRELGPEDYELLLLLDENVVKKAKVLNDEEASNLPRATGTAWIDEACPICLCALEEDEDVRWLPTCGHHFHAPCAHRWLTGEKATCPVCGREESKQERIVNLFRKFDQNGDGLLELKDMKALLEKLDAGFWDSERLDRFFVTADVKQDGKLDIEEFVNWVFFKETAPEAPELMRNVTRNRIQEIAAS